jgi:hypothetical protein
MTPVGARSRATGAARLKTVFAGSEAPFCNIPDARANGLFVVHKRATPVAQERAPTGVIPATARDALCAGARPVQELFNLLHHSLLDACHFSKVLLG